MKEHEILKRLAKKLGEYQTRNNDEYGFECPKCSKYIGKFHLGINLRKGLFHCFRCNYSGHINNLGLGLEAVHHKKKELREKLELPRLPGYVPLFSHKTPVEERSKILKYLKTRSVGPVRAKRMGIGYTTDPHLSGRFLIPIVEGGLCRYWVARLIATEVPSRATTGISDGGIPKEIGPRSGLGWDRRSEVLYGLDEIPEGVHVVLVEGVFDAEYLKSLGYFAVSMLGSGISDIQVGKILSKYPARITVFFDGDEGGKKGAERAESMLKARYRGPISCVDTPQGTDPDDMPPKMIKRYLDNT